LSAVQVSRYGRFVDDPSPADLERFFRMDAATRELASSKRRPHNRLGWAVQWGTVRMLGTFLTDDPVAVPDVVVEFVAHQLDIVDTACFKAYAARPQTAYEHAWAIRERYGYREFAEAELELRAYVASRVWNSLDPRRTLFDRAVVWLVKNGVLLPGITVLARAVAEVRSGEHALIHAVVDEAIPASLRHRLVELLAVPDGEVFSTLEKLRTPPKDRTGKAQKQALERVSQIKALGGGEVDVSRVPPIKLAELAHYGMAAKAPTLRDLAHPRRTATLLATVRHLETASVDDALLLFDVLMATNLLATAGRQGQVEKASAFPRLRRAAVTIAKAMDVMMGTEPDADDEPSTVAELWVKIEAVVTRGELAQALGTIEAFLPGEDDDEELAWRSELVGRLATVRGFLGLLGHAIPWGATRDGEPIIAALRDLPEVLARRAPTAEHVEEHQDLVKGSWRRLVYANPALAPGLIDKAAYTFCVLEALWRALRCRDVYATGADKWGDPRARLLSGAPWAIARERVLRSLELSGIPGPHLDELTVLLDETYLHVVDGLASNTSVEVVDGRIRLERLGAEPEPPGMSAIVEAVSGMLPRIDYPDLLLEVDAATGMFGGFTHISGALSPTEDLDISLAAVLLSESCNIPLAEVAKPGIKALTLGRLVGADQGYFRAECIRQASGLLVDKQAEIDITGNWGGGLVASADGMRFVVPVRTLHAGPNPKYFGPKRGVTWLNVVSDRVMGLGGLVVPGTLRDSMVILDAIFNLDVPTAPEMIITDNASYSDIVFGLFAICGYQFAPRIADISDARLWRIRTRLATSYGALDAVSRNSISVRTIGVHWEDMLRVAGSLTTGQVRAYDLIRMMQHDRRTTGLGKAFAHYGRIFKTLHLLQFIDDVNYRRMIGNQLNIGESRHSLAREIAFGRRGHLFQAYRTGMEDQLSGLGLGLNAVVYWNSVYIDAAVKALEASGTIINDEIKARISPLEFGHITFHGRYTFRRPELAGSLRPLRDPKAASE